jgi:glycolate oxidase
VLGLESFLIGGQRIFAGKRTRKGVTGYDVAALLVGSEGTLAVFGDVTLRLIPKPPVVMTLMALFASVRDAGDAVGRITAAGLVPRCIELLDSATLEAMRRAGNAIDQRAGAMLLIEVDGAPRHCEIEANRVSDACDNALSLLVAQDASQREKLWSARREMSLAVRRLAKNKLAEDVVVPRQQITELLDRVASASEELGLRTLTYGHAGDGNLHVNFLWDEPDEVQRVQLGIERLFRDTVALGGTLSGEHGIGVLKAEYLPLEQSPELITLQRDLKRVFDPQGLLNPGKIFPSGGHRAC